MTASRRISLRALSGTAAALALALGTPSAAQESDAPVDVTAAPPPSAETIGPSQLRDFNLRGTVTRPADQQAVTPAQPANTAPAAPRSGEAVPGEAAAPSAARGAPSTSPQTRPAATAANNQLAARSSGAAPVTPSAPLEVTTNPAPQEGDAGSETPASLEPAGGMPSWPWIAALIALLGGGAFLAWTRRGRRQRYADPGRLAFAGIAVPDAEAEPAPLPPARPRPDPVPPRATPAPAPRADPVPVPTRKAAGDGLIVASSLKPQLNVEFLPDRVVVTEQDVMLQFEIVLSNVGSAPARDVLVEGRLFTAHAGQDREIGEFFHNPMTEGDRMTAIAPLGRISLKSVARLPLDQIHKFEAAGRKLFVPMMGFNILYRSGGGEGQASASFLVGRGSEQDEKLAPFRIDQGSRIYRGLSARAHSIGLQPA